MSKTLDTDGPGNAAATAGATIRLERWLLGGICLAILALSALLLLPNTRGQAAQKQDRDEILAAVNACRAEGMQRHRAEVERLEARANGDSGAGAGADRPQATAIVVVAGIVSSQCAERVRQEGMLSEFAIRRAAFAEQAYQGRVILWMVVVITISGVGMACLQMLLGFRLAGLGRGRREENESEVTIERGKIAVRSSITGLLILVVSFAFFLVYVLWIYTIEEASPLGQAGNPARATAKTEFGTTSPPSGGTTPAAGTAGPPPGASNQLVPANRPSQP